MLRRMAELVEKLWKQLHTQNSREFHRLSPRTIFAVFKHFPSKKRRKKTGTLFGPFWIFFAHFLTRFWNFSSTKRIRTETYREILIGLQKFPSFRGVWRVPYIPHKKTRHEPLIDLNKTGKIDLRATRSSNRVRPGSKKSWTKLIQVWKKSGTKVVQKVISQRKILKGKISEKVVRRFFDKYGDVLPGRMTDRTPPGIAMGRTTTPPQTRRTTTTTTHAEQNHNATPRYPRPRDFTTRKTNENTTMKRQPSDHSRKTLNDRNNRRVSRSTNMIAKFKIRESSTACDQRKRRAKKNSKKHAKKTKKWTNFFVPKTKK